LVALARLLLFVAILRGFALGRLVLFGLLLGGLFVGLRLLVVGGFHRLVFLRGGGLLFLRRAGLLLVGLHRLVVLLPLGLRGRRCRRRGRRDALCLRCLGGRGG